MRKGTRSAAAGTDIGAGDGAAEARRRRLLVVTGLSGAGHTTALKFLEDMGYEAVDNLPIFLLAGLMTAGGDLSRSMAIGVDCRTRDFSAAALGEQLDRLEADAGYEVRLLFLDCADEALRRRFTETRRRHPLALDRPVSDGIRQERTLLAAMRDRADVVMDTTALSTADLRRELRGHFALDRQAETTISVTSFSYRRGLPREADLVFDARFLHNPHYDPALRPLTGRDPPVGERIAADPFYGRFFAALTELLLPLLPRFEREGKSYLTIAVGCTGGRHRSVYVAEQLAGWLAAQGRSVTIRHRDLGDDARDDG